MDFFCDLGAPLILQSDNGREFKNALLFNILNENWPSTKIIHGKPRHPETQGSVEKANQDIKRHFTAMMFDNSENSWVKFVRQVQYKKNTSFHSTIGMTPFQALVHRKPPLGLTELGIPIEAIDNIWSEDDLERITEEMNNQSTPPRPEVYDNICEVHYYERQDTAIPLYSDQSDIYMKEISLPPSSNLHVFEENTHPESPGISKFPPINNSNQPHASILPQASIHEPTNSISSVQLGIHSLDTTFPSQSEDTPECAECNNETSGAHRCPGCKCYMHVICGRSNGEEGFGAGIWCSKCDLHRLQQESEVERIGIKRRQSKFHSRMLKSSASKMTSANVGDTVIIPIAKPDVMIPLGSKNLMGVIMDKNEDLYAIGTDQGRLESRYTRNQFDVCPTKLQKIDSVPDSVISQTTAMQNASMFVL